MNHTDMFRNDLADAARIAVEVPARIATDGHAQPCTTCHMTIDAATPYFRCDGAAYCCNCATAWAPFMGLMAAWQKAQAGRAAEAARSERRLSARERSMRRKLHSEWREIEDLEAQHEPAV